MLDNNLAGLSSNETDKTIIHASIRQQEKTTLVQLVTVSGVSGQLPSAWL